MVQTILTCCDICKAETGEDVPGEIVDTIFHTADPKDPTTVRIVEGTLDLCAEHQKPFAAVAEMYQAYGRTLNADAQDTLVAAIRNKETKDPATEKVLCMECPTPKSLRPGSLPNHAEKFHGKSKKDLRIQPDIPGPRRIYA